VIVRSLLRGFRPGFSLSFQVQPPFLVREGHPHPSTSPLCFRKQRPQGGIFYIIVIFSHPPRSSPFRSSLAPLRRDFGQASFFLFDWKHPLRRNFASLLSWFQIRIISVKFCKVISSLSVHPIFCAIDGAHLFPTVRRALSCELLVPNCPPPFRCGVQNDLSIGISFPSPFCSLLLF